MSDDSASAGPPVTARLDVRLATAAVAAWVGAPVGLLIGSRAPVATATVASAVGVLLALVVAFGPHSHLVRTLLVGAIAAMVGVGAAAFRLMPLSAGPLASLAGDGAAVTADVRLDADPVRRAAAVVGDRRGPALVEVGADLLRFTARGQSWVTRVPVLVRGSADLLAYGPGTRLTVSGVLRPAGYRVGVAAVVSLRAPPLVSAPAPALLARTTLMRHRLAADCAGLSPDIRGLLPGLVVGDTSAAPAELLADMKVTGLTHLVAVSGTNTAMVLAALLALTARLRRSIRVAAALLGLAGFVVLVRPQPSVSRAAVMGLIAVSALVLGGRRAALPSLAAAVLGLVVVDPWLSITYGFALSVCATAGLVLIAPPVADALRRRFNRMPGLMLDAVAVSLAAQVATIPLIIALAGYVSFTSLPANLLAAPAVGPATVLGVAAVIAGQWAPPLAGPLVHLAALPTWWIAQVAHRLAGLPTLGVPKGMYGGLLGLGLVLLAAWLVVRGRRHPRILVGAILVVVLGRSMPARGPANWPPPDWLAVVCDVGQGDQIVLADGPGRAIVVDSGPDPVWADRCLARLRVSAIDLLLLTHFHADHVAGLSGILRHRKVATAFVSPYADPAGEAGMAMAGLERARISSRPAQAGDRIATAAWDLTVLWPPAPDEPGAATARGGGPNDESLVIAAVHRASGVRILLTGDAGPAPQAELEPAVRGGADVVKVPHHGSAYQAVGFAGAVRPRFAIVSVGAGNPFGHPVRATLDAFRLVGSAVLRTDESGDVAVCWSGTEVSLRNQR